MANAILNFHFDFPHPSLMNDVGIGIMRMNYKATYLSAILIFWRRDKAYLIHPRSFLQKLEQFAKSAEIARSTRRLFAQRKQNNAKSCRDGNNIND